MQDTALKLSLFLLFVCLVGVFCVCGAGGDPISPINAPTLGVDQRLRPLCCMNLILSGWHHLHFERFSRERGLDFPASLVVAFSNLIHTNGHYVTSGCFANCGVSVEVWLCETTETQKCPYKLVKNNTDVILCCD